jgi:sugar phosphate isomerase/epimerase
VADVRRQRTMDRRTFVETAGGAALASLTLSSPLTAYRSRRLDRIGVQLYTVRDRMAKDFEGTLAQVATIGYREVEFVGYFGKDPREVRATLDRHGLAAPAAHIGLTPPDQWRAALDGAHVVGHRYLVVAWIPPEARRTLEDYKRAAESFNRAGAEAKAAGIQFAYHNHDFEFERLDRRLPYDVLLAETDPQLVQLEMDLYWITKGGQDPLAYFARYPGRFPMVHVKDSMGPPEHKMVDVGAGTIGWGKIFARREQGGIRHFFVEHDQPPDPFGSIRASYEYLKRLEF